MEDVWTGWPPGLLQDDSLALSKWFSSRLGARWELEQQMNDMAMRRKLLEQAQLMVRTNNPEVCMQQFAGILNTLGDLLSAWTGEKVRVHITAAGQGEAVDMQKAPESASTAHH